MTDWLEKLANKQTLSVSQLNNTAKHLLESQFQTVWVEGEISNFSRPASGHWYFTLKDEYAQIRCAMFKGKNMRLRKTPKNGDAITLRGTVSLYAPRGDYQLIADNIIDEGAGKLQQAFDALKQKLDSQGWFAEEHKRTLPHRPSRIAVITSETGAVWHDIQTTFKRRNPFTTLYLVPVAVQGEHATQEILQAFNTVQQHQNSLDAVILARGGGSLEDMAAFNSEPVAHAVFNCALPVVVAIGHETDFSIAEFVADKRGATPTAAAELLSPDIQQDALQLKSQQHRLDNAFIRLYQTKHQQLKERKARLKHPQTRVNEQRQRIDELETRLHNAVQQTIATAKLTLSVHKNQLNQVGPVMQLPTLQQKLQFLSSALHKNAAAMQQRYKQRFTITASTLHSVSPLATLERGYSIVKDSNDRAVSSVSQLTPKQAVTLTLKDGQVNAQITD